MPQPRTRVVRTMVALAALSAPPALAGQIVHVAASKPQTIALAGGFAMLADPTTGTIYQGTDIFGDPASSFPMIYDSGASGNLLSNFSSSSLNIPTTGESYSDVGIGGTEVFNVSVKTRLLLAPVSIGEGNSEDSSLFSNYGDFKFQVKQQDASVQGVDMPFDIAGTPVLRSRVMHVQPNITSDFSTFAPLVDYMRTDLLSSMPSNLPAKGVFKIPVQYKNFIDTSKGAPPVTTENNPVIAGVQIEDARKAANQQSAPREWLLDTGGSVTIIGRDYATEVGIDLTNETPVSTTQVVGVGNDIRTLNGYRVDHLVIPMGNGDQLVYDNEVVFVPADDNTLPADLGGILGVNNFAPSFSQIDDTIGPTDTVNTRYSDWYLDGPGNQLVLVDPNSDFVASAPEPASLALLLTGSIGLLARRRRVRAAAAA